MILLKKTHKNDLNLGYGELPLYASPVAMSIAEAQIKVEKYDDAIDTYQYLLKRFPKSAYVYKIEIYEISIHRISNGKIA